MSNSLSVGHPVNVSSGEIKCSKILKQTAKEDLFAADEVLHEYPEMPLKTKFIKSVDEGTFSKLKAGTDVNSATIKERGASLSTIEHIGGSQINPFAQGAFPIQNQSHVRSSTISSKPRKEEAKHGDLLQNQSIESSSASQLNHQAQHSANPHTSIVVRNQINIINNGTSQPSTLAHGSGLHQHHQKTAPTAKSQMVQSQPVTGGGNSRSKVSSRKASQI